MRRADYLPLAPLALLAGFIGVVVLRDPVVPASATASNAEHALTDAPVVSTAQLRVPTGSVAPSRKGHDISLAMRRSSLAAPKFDAADVRRQLNAGAAGTYILAMLSEDVGLARWPERPLNPISVWVEPYSTIADWRPEYVTMARDAFDVWRNAGIPVRVTFPIDSAGADIRITWADQFPDSRIGTTRRFRDQHWWLVSGDISLAVHETSGNPLDPEIVALAAIHEAGHVLGLNHSPDTTDLMAPKHHSAMTPSAADLATIRLLYSVPPGKLDAGKK